MIPQFSDDPFAQILALEANEDLVQPAEFTLKTNACTIGRSPTCQIVVQQHLVSRLHAKIERDGPRYLLSDSKSANGTFVNGQRIHEPHLLQNDDLIGLGTPKPLFRFLDPDPTSMAAVPLRYDERTMTFFLGQHAIDLTSAQFRLLSHLYQNEGSVCKRESCAQAIWGREYNPGLDADALDDAISKLRIRFRQIDPNADLIRTRRGLGYELVL